MPSFEVARECVLDIGREDALFAVGLGGAAFLSRQFPPSVVGGPRGFAGRSVGRVRGDDSLLLLSFSRARAASLSRAYFSSISFSLEAASTGFASPKGLERARMAVGFADLGEPTGEVAPD